MRLERACEECLRRTWLLAWLGAHIEPHRGRLDSILALADDELIAAVGGGHRARVVREHGRFDSAQSRERAEDAGVETVCRCHPDYPRRLLALRAPPAVLHLLGSDAGDLWQLSALEPVAIVGARRASSYGLEVARSLAGDLAVCRVPVISGMAVGIDSAAHAGALQRHGMTVAVLPTAVDRPYPRSKRLLYQQIVERGLAISELPLGCVDTWRWMFPARNRLIAALAVMTVVVEAEQRSGSLVTARYARELARPLGAVPGRITTRQAAGTLELLAGGALVVRGAPDVLDHVFAAGRLGACEEHRDPLGPELCRLLEAIHEGHDTSTALVRAGFTADRGLTALAELELAGYVRRQAGGRFTVVP